MAKGFGTTDRGKGKVQAKVKVQRSDYYGRCCPSKLENCSIAGKMHIAEFR